ncbi:MAG: hypothetical protein II781_04245, partial [Clostridia bacterium]|nr:hypothetical protein [Clostridia bacterium]
TLAKLLSEALPAEIVKVYHMDSYFLHPSPRTIAPITRKEYVEHNHPDSEDLPRLRADLRHEIETNEFKLILVEGLFTLQDDEIRNMLDLKVFVDLKSDERIVRRIKRWMRGGEDMDSITDRYLDTVRFRHDEFVEPSRWHADMVINGTLSETGVDLLLTYIRQKIDC